MTTMTQEEFAEAATRIVSKLGEAAVGERKDVFILALASFTATCCERFNIAINEFTDLMKGDS